MYRPRLDRIDFAPMAAFEPLHSTTMDFVDQYGKP